MGFFSFHNQFEIEVNRSKRVAFDKFVSYIKKKSGFQLTSTQNGESLTFTKGITLLSWPINFEVVFKEVDKENTMLCVRSESGNIDLGRSKGIINDIVEEIY